MILPLAEKYSSISALQHGKEASKDLDVLLREAQKHKKGKKKYVLVMKSVFKIRDK